MAEARCGHPKADGEPCPIEFGLCPACGLCFHHDPCRETERKAARRKGGHVAKVKSAARTEDAKFRPAARPPAPPTNAAEARDYLAWLLDQGTTGNLGSQRAYHMAGVCKLFIDAVKVADIETEIGRMRAEMAAMREAGR